MVPGAIKEWERGHARGWNWDFEGPIPRWQSQSFSTTFMLGYQVGKAEIDRLVEEAAYCHANGDKY